MVEVVLGVDGIVVAAAFATSIDHARIVQIADVFDALRTDRPYRPGLSVPKIIEIMRRDVGTFFDADLLQVFLQEVVSRGLPEPFA